MKKITLEELLEAGCHFGHQVTRQNPKAREFIFEARDGIHIIDLEKTKEGLEDAAKHVYDVAKKGGTMLVLSTKRQAQEVLREERKRVASADGLYFVTQRWIGGTLTNFQEVSKNYKKLKDLTANLQDEFEKAKYTKKEVGDWEKTRQKLEGFYGGTKDLMKAPDLLFIIDTHIEHVAVREARAVRVPIVGITDTNSDPTLIDYPIPANDDAKGSLELIVSYIFDAWIEGQTAHKEAPTEEVTEKKEAAKEQKPKAEQAKEGEAASAKKKETVKTDKPAAAAKPKKTVTKKKEATK